LGSNRTWAWSFEAIIASALLLVVFSCSVFAQKCISFERIQKMKLELLLIVTWLLVNVLYLIPLPIGLLNILSPTVASAYAGLGVEYGYLSLDVYATYEVLLLSLYYFSLFVLGVLLVNSRKRVKIVLALFLFLGVFEAVYGMYLVSIDQTGTLVQVTTVTTNNASGTFINKNHLVAFLSMCFLLGLALRQVLSRNQKKQFQSPLPIKFVRFISHPIRLLDFCLFLILMGIWNTHSRSGLASFVLAIVFLLVMFLIDNKLKAFTYKTIGATFVAILLVFIVVADDINYLLNSLGVNADDSMNYIANSAEGRLLAFNQVLDNYSHYWFSGVGPGAYQVFFVNHRLLDQTAYFDHAHNDYLEFAIEYGLFSLILLFLVVLFLYKMIKFQFKTKSRFYKMTSISVISCIVYMLFHGNMDFNARIPANIMTIIVVISTVYGRIVMSSINNNEDL
jgi:O-antigen ligase